MHRQRAGCYAFSPTIRKKGTGSTIHSVDIRDPKRTIYFTPFEEDEAKENTQSQGVTNSPVVLVYPRFLPLCLI